MTRDAGVRELREDEGPDVVVVLAEAFRDYPVMRWVLGPAAPYDERLHRLVRLFVMARVLRGETLLGVGSPGGLRAAALVSRPGGPAGPGLGALREETWAALGADARTRYERFGAATAGFRWPASHLHLNMIGVRPEEQGRGWARVLLEAVHARSAGDPGSEGVSLTTELAANVPLYERFGYGVVGRAEVGSAFTTWGMFRPDGGGP